MYVTLAQLQSCFSLGCWLEDRSFNILRLAQETDGQSLTQPQPPTPIRKLSSATCCTFRKDCMWSKVHEGIRSSERLQCVAMHAPLLDVLRRAGPNVRSTRQ